MKYATPSSTVARTDTQLARWKLRSSGSIRADMSGVFAGLHLTDGGVVAWDPPSLMPPEIVNLM
jgi:hypothetical protein